MPVLFIAALGEFLLKSRRQMFQKLTEAIAEFYYSTRFLLRLFILRVFSQCRAARVSNGCTSRATFAAISSSAISKS
jgi:hypothetical protein